LWWLLVGVVVVKEQITMQTLAEMAEMAAQLHLVPM
jgi:hypothetical protein